MKSRALISGVTAATDEHLRTDHLKLCFLWYDEIIVEPIGQYNESAFIRRLLGAEADARPTAHALTDVIRPLDLRIREEITGGLEAEASRGYPRWGDNWEHYTYPEPETPAQFAHNALLAKIAEERGLERFEDGYEIEKAEGRARVAVDAVTLWEGVNQEMPCMLQASSDERTAMIAASRFGASASTEDVPLKLLEANIPSLRGVPWTSIVKFRQNSAMQSLRDKIARSIEKSRGDSETAMISFAELELKATDSLVDGARPRTKRVAFEALVANIPGLPVNPFSLYFGARDTVRHHRGQQDHGWFYLLRDIRSAARATSKDGVDP